MIVSQGGEAPLAMRATDGRPLEIPNLLEKLNKSIAITSEGLVQIESGTSSSILGLTRANLVVRAYDPIREAERWKVEFPSNTYFSLLEYDHLAGLELSRKFHLLDLRTGERRTFDALPESALRYRAEMHVLGDSDHIYLIVNQSRRRSHFYSSNGLSTLNVNGTVYAFDRQTGRKLWEQKVQNQQLIREQLAHSPVLVFSSRKYERQQNVTTWATTLLLLDKRTGRQLIDTSLSSQYSGGFQSFKLDLAERTVELISYNQRIRLVAKAREEQAVEAPAAAVSAR